MRLNSSILLPCAAGVLFIALAVMWLPFIQGRRWGGDRFLAVPKANRTIGVNMELLEELSEEKIMLTYEVNQERLVRGVKTLHSVMVKGTNYIYPFVMECNILRGGFFTKEAQEQRLKAAVLNEAAAFEIFGTVDITGTEVFINDLPYLVVGVIGDGDSENKNLYIPITLMEEGPNAFISILNEGKGVSVPYTLNEYKQLGITEDNYEFINLDDLNRIIEERFFTALKMAAAAIGAAFIFRLKIKGRRWAAAGVVVWPTFMGLKGFIRWKDSWDMLGSYRGDCFGNQLGFMQDREFYFNIVFISFMILIVFYICIQFVKMDKPLKEILIS